MSQVKFTSISHFSRALKIGSAVQTPPQLSIVYACNLLLDELQFLYMQTKIPPPKTEKYEKVLMF